MDKRVTQLRNAILKIAGILILLLAALFPAKFINSVYGYLPFCGLVFLILLSNLYFLIIKGQICFEAEAFDTVCQRGEKVNVSLKIVNGSILMCPKACAYVYVSEFFSEDDSVLPTTFTMNGKSESEFSFGIKMNHIGMYTAGIKTLQIYDMLGIFSITIPGSKYFTVTVLPNTILSEEVKLEDKQLTESQTVQKNMISDGFDYTGVREYARGDSMKRIHWKLSAHSSDFMTKITETSNKSDMTVVIDFVAPPIDREMLPGIYDCLIETGLSFIEQALSKDIEYSMLFIGRDRELTRVIPKGEQDYKNLVSLMPVIYTNPGPDILDGVGILEKERHISNRSSNIILCTSRITEQLIQELITVRQQQRNPMLYHIIPPDLENNEMEDLKAALRALDDYGIYYHLVSAEAVSQQ